MRLTRVAIAAAPVLFVLLWSTGFIGARYGLPYIEPLTFLAVRMVFVVLILGAIALIARRALAERAGDRPQPGGRRAGARALSRRRVHRHQPGRAGRHLGADPGPAADPHLDHRQSLHGRDGDAAAMARPRARPDRRRAGAARPPHRGGGLGRSAGSRASSRCIGITLGTLYQKRYCGGIDWRTGNLVQYVGAARAVRPRRLRLRDARDPLDRRTGLRHGLAGARAVDRRGRADVLADPPLGGDRLCQPVLSGAGGDRADGLSSCSARSSTRCRSPAWWSARSAWCWSTAARA